MVVFPEFFIRWFALKINFSNWRNFTISNNNKIKNSGYSGIYSYNLTNPTSYRGSFTNNEIAGGFKSTNPYPVNFSTTTNMDMYHNSVVHDVITTSTTAAAFYFNSGSGNTLKNNHFFVAKTTSTAAPVYISPATAFTQMNYNNLYKDGIDNLFLRIN